ncbi:MAG: fatty acid desaturase [Pirellulaceae bacterium]
MKASQLSDRFSITQAKSLVKDLSHANPWIYWADFTASILTGHACFFILLRVEQITQWSGASLWAAWFALFAMTAILYMRSVMFIHELVHLPNRGFAFFRIAWNLLCGIPFLSPSFLYYPHVDHHRRKHYGTDHDGEYLDLSHRHPGHILLFLVASAVVPVAAFARFLVMTPIAWVFPAFRQWVERHASSMIIDVFYLRGDHGPHAKRIMRLQEVACFLWCLAIALRAPLVSGQLIDGFVIQAYLVSVTLILINNVRTLGAHRWMGDGRELTFEEQLLDSVNYPYRPWITELWGPTGTRYHALHHLFPSIPYHNLGIAHRRLVAGLPADSMYHDTVRVSLIGAIAELWQRSRNRKYVDPRLPQKQAA